MNIFGSDRKDPFHRANSLEELCGMADADFVNCAFVTILGRQADPDGCAHYVRQLRRGVAKLTIINALRRSNEGRRHDPGIRGLDRILRRHHRASLPVIGPLLGLFTGAEGNSPIERRFRAFENSVHIDRELATARFSLLHHYVVVADKKIDSLNELARSALRGSNETQRLAEAEDTGRESWERTLATALDG
jgi:hypothetical protein